MENLRDDEIITELRRALTDVRMNILDDHCDPKVKRTITLKITVDPMGDIDAEPRMDAQISTKLAPRHSTRVASAISQIELFPFSRLAISADGEILEDPAE